MVRDPNQRLLRKYAQLAQYAVTRPGADRRFRFLGRGSAIGPALDDDRRDPLARLPPRDAFAHADDLAGPIGKRNGRQLHSRVIGAADNHDIPVIERCRTKPDEHFTWAGRRLGPLDQCKTVYAKLLYLPSLHFFS